MPERNIFPTQTTVRRPVYIGSDNQLLFRFTTAQVTGTATRFPMNLQNATRMVLRLRDHQAFLLDPTTAFANVYEATNLRAGVVDIGTDTGGLLALRLGLVPDVVPAEYELQLLAWEAGGDTQPTVLLHELDPDFRFMPIYTQVAA